MWCSVLSPLSLRRETASADGEKAVQPMTNQRQSQADDGDLGLRSCEATHQARRINLFRLSIFFRVIGCSFLRLCDWLAFILGLFQVNKTENEVGSDFGSGFREGTVMSLHAACWEQGERLFVLLCPECGQPLGLFPQTGPFSPEKAAGDLVRTPWNTMCLNS